SLASLPALCALRSGVRARDCSRQLHSGAPTDRSHGRVLRRSRKAPPASVEDPGPLRDRRPPGEADAATAVWDRSGPDTLHSILRPPAVPKRARNIFPSAYRDRARGAALRQGARSNRSCRKTFAAGTMRDCVWVRHLEPALLQIFAEIEHRSAHEKRALWINHDTHILRFDENIAVRRAIDQIHFVLQAGATAANHRDPQRSVRATLFL